MKIELTPSQVANLQAAVAAGTYPSIEAAVQHALDQILPLDTDDLSWAKPYVDRALESVARGDVISGEDFLKSLEAKLQDLRSS